jgi:hypothetical protein
MVEILPQMYSLLFSMVQWFDGLYFWGKIQCFIAHLTAKKNWHKVVKCLTLMNRAS